MGGEGGVSGGKGWCVSRVEGWCVSWGGGVSRGKGSV